MSLLVVMKGRPRVATNGSGMKKVGLLEAVPDRLVVAMKEVAPLKAARDCLVAPLEEADLLEATMNRLLEVVKDLLDQSLQSWAVTVDQMEGPSVEVGGVSKYFQF